MYHYISQLYLPFINRRRICNIFYSMGVLNLFNIGIKIFTVAFKNAPLMRSRRAAQGFKVGKGLITRRAAGSSEDRGRPTLIKS